MYNIIYVYNIQMALIDHGGFGCVFSPELACNSSFKKKHTNKTKKYVSKLQTLKDSEYEYNMMKLFTKRIKRILPNYNQYFVLDDINICTPKLSKKELQKKYTDCTILNNSNDFKNLVLPNMGINLEKYLYHIFPEINNNFIIINKKLINLYSKAIIPMNKLGFYHNDLKVTNILVDDQFNFRIIDFGLMNNIRYKYFAFNNPLNSILLDDAFITYYINNVNKMTTKELLVNYLLQYKLYKDAHYVQLIQPLLLMIEPTTITKETARVHPLLFNYYVKYINTNIPYTKLIKKNRLVYIHNLDTIGFLSIYASIYLIYKSNTPDPNSNTCIINALKSLYLKYIFMIGNITYSEFINDVYKLNLCF